MGGYETRPYIPNMFDDKKQPVEDMFSGTEEEAVPTKPATPLLTPPPMATQTRPVQAPSVATEPAALPDAPRHHSGLGAVKLALVVVIVLVLVAGAAYAAYQVMVRQPTDGGIVKSVSDDGVVAADDTTEDEKPVEVVEEPVEEEKTPNKGTFLDSDGDGLTNAEELEAGTLSNNPDTDGDGLGDREEVKVYETDPREADTDGDTFLDGQEVAGGYNPNGDGRLFNVPSNP